MSKVNIGWQEIYNQIRPTLESLVKFNAENPPQALSTFPIYYRNDPSVPPNSVVDKDDYTFIATNVQGLAHIERSIYTRGRSIHDFERIEHDGKQYDVVETLFTSSLNRKFKAKIWSFGSKEFAFAVGYVVQDQYASEKKKAKKALREDGEVVQNDVAVQNQQALGETTSDITQWLDDWANDESNSEERAERLLETAPRSPRTSNQE
jgi:hypothetical protein